MTFRILTAWEVAGVFKIDEKTIYRLSSYGLIPGHKVGGSWRFRAEDNDVWIAAGVLKTANGRPATSKIEYPSEQTFRKDHGQ